MPSSGTTWTQQIVAQLIFAGADGLDVADMSPWVDLRVPPKDVKLPQVEANDSPPLPQDPSAGDALVFSPQAKYIYVAATAATWSGACTITTQCQRALVTSCSMTLQGG
jgi:hypothetical protein